MGEEKKKSKAVDVFYYIGITAAAIAFCFFGYMKLADMEVFLFNRIIGCYTICFTAVTGFILVRIYAMYKRTKKADYQLWLMIIAGVISVACLINSAAEDFGKSKIKEEIIVNEATSVYLCESTQKNGHTKIEVYRVRDRIAKKLGEIDEKPFSVRCVADKRFSSDVSENGDIITIHCEYGEYRDERVELKPGYDKGVLSYPFALD